MNIIFEYYVNFFKNYAHTLIPKVRGKKAFESNSPILAVLVSDLIDIFSPFLYIRSQRVSNLFSEIGSIKQDSTIYHG